MASRSFTMFYGNPKRRLSIYLMLTSVIWIALSAMASATSVTAVATDNPDAVDAGFKLKGSHGYSIGVAVYSEGSGRAGTIYIGVSRKGASASYKAQASVTPEAIHVDLGNLAKIDLARRASGRTKTVHPKCLGGAFTYEPGTYEGVVEFNGEDGYTRARANRVAQLPSLLVSLGGGPCGGGYGEAISPDLPGARLRGISVGHGRALSFQVNKNGPKANMVFSAALKERRSGIRIDRALTGVAPPNAFRFDPALRTAILRPPAPFSGTASLARSRNSLWPTWTGDLKLNFPGHTVSLAEPGVQVSLVHARFTQNPGPNAYIRGAPSSMTG
jgi:hypothetical protein